MIIIGFLVGVQLSASSSQPESRFHVVRCWGWQSYVPYHGTVVCTAQSVWLNAYTFCIVTYLKRRSGGVGEATEWRMFRHREKKQWAWGTLLPCCFHNVAKQPDSRCDETIQSVCAPRRPRSCTGENTLVSGYDLLNRLVKIAGTDFFGQQE